MIQFFLNFLQTVQYSFADINVGGQVYTDRYIDLERVRSYYIMGIVIRWSIVDSDISSREFPETISKNSLIFIL